MSTEPSQPSESPPASSPPRPVPVPRDGGNRGGGGGLSGFAQEALRRAKAVTASSVESAPPTAERPAKRPDAPRPAPQSTESPVAEGAASTDQSGSPVADAATAPSTPATGQQGRGPGGDRSGGGRPRRDGDRPRGRRNNDKDDGTNDKPRENRNEFKPPPPIPIPNRRGPMPDDLQAEIDAALGGLSLDEIVGNQSAVAPASSRLENESRHRGQVVEVHGDNVFFTLGGKNQGVCSLRNFATPPEPGQVIDVVVTGFNPEDELHELTVPGGTLVASDWGDIAEGSLVEAVVTGANTGGLECQVKKIRGFIPASQISVFRVENLGEMVGQKLVCVVTEANQGRGNLVLSRRAVLEREKEEGKKKTMAELEVGQLREGIVRRIQDFGAFVDIGGVDGLIHISQLSWERVKHPSEILQEGQKIRVRVEKIDPETGKIGLSLKNPEEHPWMNIEARFPPGTTIRGPVTRIAQFGAFVRVAPGVEGLIHVSEIAHQRVHKIENFIKEGDEVEAKVLTVDTEQQRMGLSLKATIAKPEKASDKPKEDAVEVDEPPRALAVPKRSGPLRGGTGKGGGGDQFGLKW
ncbi:MAG: S1 RNA-binding domain-containing protein [Planctomycetales bacterium]|nr:S1 RNA-binding domain-containing protein [Planctomycetales bacterium]